MHIEGIVAVSDLGKDTYQISTPTADYWVHMQIQRIGALEVDDGSDTYFRVKAVLDLPTVTSIFRTMYHRVYSRPGECYCADAKAYEVDDDFIIIVSYRYDV